MRPLRIPIIFIGAYLVAAPAASAAPISINGYTFEPGVTAPVIPADLAAEPGSDVETCLLQFDGPVEETWKDEVAALGGSFVAYIPQNAFIARMDEAQRLAIRRLPHVAWIGTYHIAYRISPDIGLMEFRSEGRRSDVMLTLRVRVAEAVDAVAARAAMLGDLLDTIRDPWNPGFIIRIDPSRLRSLAGLPNVIWVEELPETFVLNNVTKWVVQSNIDPQTPI